jgi:hypothetical protein
MKTHMGVEYCCFLSENLYAFLRTPRKYSQNICFRSEACFEQRVENETRILCPVHIICVTVFDISGNLMFWRDTEDIILF